MIKRVVKKKESKQGAILVLVVLILALAMIFITAAMMLTQATRGRLYEETMQSQARLTVTSASEVFLEALQTQEITDAQINKLLVESASAHTDNNDKIRMVIPGVPGMASKADDPNDENCTFLDIYYPDSTDKKIVHCDFTTTIGSETENVRIVLKYEPHSSPKYGNRFRNQVETNKDSGAATLRYTGGIGMITNPLVHPDDNTILFRGNALELASGGQYYSNLVFAKGATAYLGTATYKGDLIFLDGAYFSSDASATEISGDMYFFGADYTTGGFKHNGDDDVWGSISSTRFVFAGRRPQVDLSTDDGEKVEQILTRSTSRCYFIQNNTEIAINTTGVNKKGDYTVPNAGSTLPDDMQTEYSTYSTYDFTPETDPFPSSLTSVLKTIRPNGTAIAGSNESLEYSTWTVDGTAYTAGSTIPEGKEYIIDPVWPTYPDEKKVNGSVPTSRIIDLDGHTDDNRGLNDLDSNHDKIIDIEQEINHVGNGESQGGIFLIRPGAIYSNCNNIVPYVIAIDGNVGSKYRFYFEAGGSFHMQCIVFAVYNVDSSDPDPVFFVLEPGARLLAADSQYWKPDTNNSGSGLCCTGFISIDRGKDTATGIGTYIQQTKQSSEANHFGGADKYGYSTYYDNVKKPAIFIFGEGNNTLVQFGCGAVFEAYIGMYNNAEVGYETNIGGPIWIYGRIEAYKFPTYNTTGEFWMPYCPRVSDASSQNNKRPAETDYKVKEIIYYY